MGVATKSPRSNLRTLPGGTADVSPGMTMTELARVAQTKGDEHRWLRIEQRYRGDLEVTRRETSLFGSSGSWTPLLKAAGHGTMRPDPGHRMARLPGAATTDAAGSDREMILPVPNPGRESTPAGSVARWVIGPRCAQLCTLAYVTAWRGTVAGPLSGRPQAPETPSGWGGGWQSQSSTKTSAPAAMSRRRLRRGSRWPDPSADRLPRLSPGKETSYHQFWAVAQVIGRELHTIP